MAILDFVAKLDKSVGTLGTHYLQLTGVRREGRVVELSLKSVKSDPTSRQLVSQLNERIKRQFDVWILRTYQYSSWLVREKKTTKLVSEVWLKSFLYTLFDHFTCLIYPCFIYSLYVST